MDLFGRKTLQKQLDKLIDTLKQVSNDRMASMIGTLTSQIFPSYKALKEQMVYQTIDDVYSVVSRLSMTAAMIPYYGEDRQAQELDPNDRINLLLNQMTFEFKEKMHMHLLISGEIFIYKQRVEFGVNAGIPRLIILNPVDVVVKVADYFPFEIVGYRYQNVNGGTAFDIPLEDIVYIKLENPGADITDSFRGLSPIKVLATRLTRIAANMDVSVAQLQNGGLPGVLYDKSPGFTADIANQRKEAFARFINNSSNKSAPYIMGGDIGYISIGSKLADLELSDLADLDFDKICNVYGISSTWFNNKSAATESNVKEMIRQVYTNAVLPNIIRIQDAINTQLVQDFGTNGIIMYDISDVPELQEDMAQKANTYATMPVIIPNEVREGMGLDRIDDPLMDKPLIKMGYQPIEDLMIPADIPLTGDYQQIPANGVSSQNSTASDQQGQPANPQGNS